MQEKMNERVETWMDVPGLESLFQISNLGRLMRKERTWLCGNGAKRKSPAEICKLQLTSSNKHREQDLHYYCYKFWHEGKVRRISIARAVATAFIPNPENKPCIDHINRNPLDNRVENLRWVTVQENNENRGGKFENGRY